MYLNLLIAAHALAALMHRSKNLQTHRKMEICELSETHINIKTHDGTNKQNLKVTEYEFILKMTCDN